MIPSFLLAKMYVKGSLKNTDTGFEFTLKNIIEFDPVNWDRPDQRGG